MWKRSRETLQTNIEHNGNSLNLYLPHFASAELLIDKYGYFVARKTLIRNTIISNFANTTPNIII